MIDVEKSSLLIFTCPCIANIFIEYNQQDVAFHDLSSGAQNCTYSVRYLSDQHCYLPLVMLAAGSSVGLTNT